MKNTLKVIGLLSIVCIVLWLMIQVVDKEDVKEEEIKPVVAQPKEEIEEIEEEKVPVNYENIVNTDGELESKYLKNGSYEVTYIENIVLQSFEKYHIWYPTAITETSRKFPVVIFANATGVKASTYKPVFEHLASWGFIVIGTEEQFSWNGFATDMSVKLIKKLNDNETVEGYNTNPFYNKVDLDNIGIRGHSQGGIGVINSITNTESSKMYKTAISISLPNKELSKTLEWNFDASKVDIPILLISGTGDIDDKALINLTQLKEIYDEIPNTTTKVMARRNDADHGETLYYNDGYITAWFMWHLQGDMEARKVFVGNDAELKNNTLYQNQFFNIVE